jgi:hypothetical protein
MWVAFLCARGAQGILGAFAKERKGRIARPDSLAPVAFGGALRSYYFKYVNIDVIVPLGLFKYA